MRVLPEDVFDKQPLIGGGGRYILVADIRLDNRDELARSLELSLAQASHLCDAAILLKAFEVWGEASLGKLVGDYAFALWDVNERRLLLARDPLGQRPLHYHKGNSFFAFASMPKGLHTLPEIPYAIDEEKIAESLALMPEYGPRSFFQDIARIEPGQLAVVTFDHFNVRQHWNPRPNKLVLKDPFEYVDGLRTKLEQAVECRLRGEGNLGSHLSGGFDSGAVTATAAKLLTPTNRRVVAFTAIPRMGYKASNGALVDEGPLASATAALYSNIDHVLVPSDGHSILDDMNRNLFFFERPLVNICNLRWESRVCDAARERNLKIVLTGRYGNVGLSYDGREMFPESFVSGQWLRLWREAKAVTARGNSSWRTCIFWAFAPWLPRIIWIWLNRAKYKREYNVRKYTALNPKIFDDLHLNDRAKQYNFDFTYRPWKNSLLRLPYLREADPGNFNKGWLGHWQIDQRDPTADVRLLEFCLAIPAEQYFRNGVPKSLARRALSDRLPKVVLEEMRTAQQAADWYEGLTDIRGQVKLELDQIEACAPAKRTLDLPRLRKLVEQWPNGGWEEYEVEFAYRWILLRGISAGHFMRRVMGSN
jgi:asparagine synthase (glutamine-hydrolysing)